MAAFLTDLVLRVLPPPMWNECGDRKYEVFAPLLFQSDRFSGTFVCPVGKRTNLASIPRGLWNLYPRDGPWIRGAVVHDVGYEMGLLTLTGERVHLIKPYIDSLFDEMMETDGVPTHRRALFLSMVRLFGDAEALRVGLPMVGARLIGEGA